LNYTVTQIDESLWAIEEEMVRCYLFGDATASILLDTCASGGEEFPKAVSAAMPNANGRLTILLSHADPDHAAGLVPHDDFTMHPAEFERFRGLCGREIVETLCPIWDGDTRITNGRVLKILHIPGHTPGSIVVIDEEKRRAFAGDTISTGPVFMFGPGRCLEAYLESLKRMDECLVGIDDFYTCHGEMKVPRSQLNVQIRGAEMLLAGRLKAEDPPMDLPCKCYRYESCAFLY
jgi:glyoxylase-like metal-dependent hydrolase (beta-lactamase superfamily II)